MFSTMNRVVKTGDHVWINVGHTTLRYVVIEGIVEEIAPLQCGGITYKVEGQWYSNPTIGAYRLADYMLLNSLIAQQFPIVKVDKKNEQ